jgi:hypothetical protein
VSLRNNNRPFNRSLDDAIYAFVSYLDNDLGAQLKEFSAEEPETVAARRADFREALLNILDEHRLTVAQR